MGKYNGAIVTTVGQSLIANAVASNQKIIFTKMKASTHVYASTTDFEAMTSIADIVQSVDISYVGVYNNNIIQASGQFTNTGVATAFAINTIGLYGKVGSGAETLVAVVTAVNADTMPIADPVSPTSIIYNIQMTVQNSGVMEVEVNPAGTINVHQFNDALYSTVAITVPTTGWTASGSQYTKTIDVGGVTGSSMPFVELQYPDNVTATQKKAIDKAASKLVSLTTTNYGQVVLTATAIPDTSFNLLLRGLGSGQYTQPYNEFFTTVLDEEPYVSRDARDGLVKFNLVGGTVAWNQLVQNGNFESTSGWSAYKGLDLSASDNVLTFTADSSTTYEVELFHAIARTVGHKLLAMATVLVEVNSGVRFRQPIISSDTSLIANSWTLVSAIKEIQSNSTSQVSLQFSTTSGKFIKVKNIQLFDLTQMFGSAIADYVYSLEQAVEGSGIAWLRSYGFFTKDYYAYDAGSLQSVCTSGRKITALDGTVRTYPIDNEELRGLFKLDANNELYCDGDVYPSSGSVTRKYAIVDLGSLTYAKTTAFNNTTYQSQTGTSAPKVVGSAVTQQIPTAYIISANYTNNTLAVVRNGDLNKCFALFYDNGTYVSFRNDSISTTEDFKTAMSGQYLVYELDTPTTFSADPYINPQRSEGTEEFVDGLTRDVMVPVGNESTYYLSEVLPSAADYTDGQVAELALLKNYTRRTRRDITNDLAYLTRAVAEQNLEKYGYSIGDYFVGTHYTYVLGDMDTYYGGYNNQAVVNVHHVGVLVITGATSAWGSTSSGYNGSTLQSYLEDTVLTNIKADMIALFGGTTGLEHLLSHNKLFTTNDTTGWTWQSGKYISALSEIQMGYGHVFSMNAYQSGEAVKPLEVFRKFRFNEIFGNILFWLRNLMTASVACGVPGNGSMGNYDVSNAGSVVGLILFK